MKNSRVYSFDSGSYIVQSLVNFVLQLGSLLKLSLYFHNFFFSDREKLYGMLSKIAVLNEVKCQIMPKHKSSNWWKVSFHVLLKFETKAELIVKRYWVWDFCLIFFMTHKKGYLFNAYLFVGNILFCSLTLIHYREIISISWSGNSGHYYLS